MAAVSPAQGGRRGACSAGGPGARGHLLVPLLSRFDYNQINPALPFAPAGATDPISGTSTGSAATTSGATSSRACSSGRAPRYLWPSFRRWSVVLGTAIGAVAGHYVGRVDGLLMRFTDFMLALPLLPMYLFATRLIRTSPALAPWLDANPVLARWAASDCVRAVRLDGHRRLVRGSFLTLRTLDYIEASRALGAGDRRIVLRHLLPNALPPVLVAATFVVADFIILERSCRTRAGRVRARRAFVGQSARGSAERRVVRRQPQPLPGDTGLPDLPAHDNDPGERAGHQLHRRRAARARPARLAEA